MAERYVDFQRMCVEVLAIAPASLSAAQNYFRRHPVPYPCLADPTHEVFDLYGVERRTISLGQRPALFIIDREGVVRFAHVGWQQWEIPRNERVLEVCRDIGCRLPIEAEATRGPAEPRPA